MPRPPIIARGRFRCGSFTSPATYVTSFQPLYAHIAPIIAAPNPATPPRADAATPSHAEPAADNAKCAQSPRASRKAPTPTPATTDTFSAAIADAIRPLTTTAAQLMSVTTIIAALATSGR